MTLILMVGASLACQQVQAHALESELRAALSHVAYNSSHLRDIVVRVASKYKRTVGAEDQGIVLKPCFGPTPMRIMQISLDANEVDGFRPSEMVNIALWPTKTGTNVQYLDWAREFDYSEDYPMFIDGQAYRDGDRLIRCGCTPIARRIDAPVARVYRLRKGRWQVVANYCQRGSWGRAKFKQRNGQVMPEIIEASTWDDPVNYGAAMSSPHLSYVQDWFVHNHRFDLGPRRLVQNEVAELDRLTGLARHGQRTVFTSRVPKSIAAQLWHLLRGHYGCRYSDITRQPNIESIDLEDTTGTEDLTFSITFARQDGKWRAVGLTHKRAG